MSEIIVTIGMPAVRCGFKASYSEVKRPTGIQTILLLHIGSPSTRGMTVSEAMSKMGIHGDIVEKIVIPAIEGLMDAGMIMGHRPEADTPLSSYEFTDEGQEALEKGVITERLEHFVGDVVYRPGITGEKYARYNPEGFVSAGFPGRGSEGVEADFQKVENEVCRNKERYGVPKSADVFDVQPDGPGELLRYDAGLRLEMDQASGDMRITSTDLDTNFVKSAFTAEDILGGVPQGVLSLKGEGNGVKTWRRWTPDMTGMFMLPWDLSLDARRSVVLYDPGTCDASGAIAVEGLGADIVVMESQSTAYEYLMAERDLSVAGLEGSRPMRVAIRRRLDPERMERLVGLAVDAFPAPGGIADLRAVLKVAVLLPDASRAKSIVAEYIRAEADPVPAAREVLKEFGVQDWFKRAVDSILEDVLVGRGSSEVRGILKKLNRRIVGRRVADHCFDTEEDPLVVMDNLDDVVTASDLAGRCDERLNENPDRGLDRRILAGDVPELTSARLIEVTRASRALSELRADFPTPQCIFDYEDLYTSERLAGIRKSISTFNKAIDSLGRIFDSVCASKDLDAYRSLFAEILEGYSETGDRRKMPARLFGIEMGIAMESALGRILQGYEGKSLNDLLEETRRRGAVSEGLYKDLDDLRVFRNRCAHRGEIPVLGKADRSRYIAAVENLEAMAESLAGEVSA